MADQNDLTCSPAWKKPSDLMKVRLKKRRASSIENFQSLAAKATAHSRLSSSDDDGSNRPGKRRNPFGQDGGPPVRRRAPQNNDAEEDKGERLDGGGDDSHSRTRGEDVMGRAGEEEGGVGGVGLFQALDSGDDKVVFEEETGKRDAESAEYQRALRVSSLGETEKPDEETNTERHSNDEHTSEFLPLDWSIKSRVRFTSPHPFSWSAPLKTTEEARGLCSFVRCEDMSGERDTKTECTSSQQSLWKARLQQSLMMWSHPHLPWLKLFPRIMLRSKSTSTSFAACDEVIQKELMASWSESLRSVFYLLRSGHCPYFYLLAHQYSVLFRAAGVGGVEHIHALFNPTTKGLREAFQEEGIEFSLPLAKMDEQKATTKLELEDEFREQYKQPSEVENSEASDPHEPDLDSAPTGDDKDVDGDDDEEEIGISQDDAGASSWLQSMGLDKQSFPTLEPSKVNFQRDHLMRIDNRPESTVLIQASDTQALYNFLLNTKTTVATTGATAGIPPTLLAPVAFQGSTLGSYKWRPSVMKQVVGNKLQESYSLEVTGPLLPHNIFSICKLLEESQDTNFSGNFNNHEPTLPFSQILTEYDQSGVERKCPAPERLSDFLAAPGAGRHTGILKELNCADGLYQW